MVYGKAAGKNRGGAAALSTQHSRSVAYCMAGRIWGEKRAGFATTRRSPAGRPAWGVGEPAEPSAPPRPHSDPSSESPAAGKETPRRCRHLLPRLPPPHRPSMLLVNPRSLPCWSLLVKGKKKVRGRWVVGGLRKRKMRCEQARVPSGPATWIPIQRQSLRLTMTLHTAVRSTISSVCV
jgi:hypothetical protein